MAGHEYTSLKALLQGSSTEGQLASVPEESTTGFTDALPPPDSYRKSIRRVSVVCSDWRIRSRQSGSTDSAASRSTNSSYSSNSESVGAADLGTSELRKIAQRMASDGYTQRMVQAFHTVSLTHTFGQDRALRNWFIELDVDWVLNVWLKLLLQEASAYSLNELVERWIRALTVIVASVDKELVTTISDAPAAARFVTASVSAMLVFVDAMVQVNGEEKLQAMLQMYICVCSASYGILPMHTVSSEAQSIFKELGNSLEREGIRLSEIISNSTKEVRTLVEEDDSWAIEILRGRGEVHKNTRFIMDCIVSMTIARTSMHNSAPSNNSENLDGLIDIEYLEDLLLRKSWLLLDPSLRYLFLLNNSYFVAHVVSESSGSFIPDDPWDLTPKLTPECKKYMDSYLDFSWGHVLSCIPKSRSLGLIHRLVNTPSLAKFQSAFHETYQAQKFWKVPDPRLREALRRAIIERVITGYRNYLEEHPELEKHVGRQSSSPQVLEEMLGELYEG
ncbi:hypothetical protein VPH35_040829 [Triticum aestivum]